MSLRRSPDAGRAKRRRAAGPAFGVCALLPPLAAATPVPEPEEFVNLLAGASGGQSAGTHHSSGNTLPLVARPWGFNHWAPQTTDDPTSWWFDAGADTFRGIRCTHQPSPWIGDYGFFLLRPHTGFATDEWLGFTSYRQEGALRPYRLDLTIGPHGVHLELAPTEHGAVLRVTFPPSMAPAQRRLCAWVPRGAAKDEDERRARAAGRPTGRCRAGAGGIDLESRRFAGGVPEGADFALRARLEAEGLRAVEDATPAECLEADTAYDPLNMQGQGRSGETGTESCRMRCAAVEGCAHFTFWSDGGCHLQDASAKAVPTRGVTAGPPRCPDAQASESRRCCFELGERSRAEVRIGTSLISAAQAAVALAEEAPPGLAPEAVAAAGRARWRELLRRVEVLDAGPPSAATWRRLQVFYTCLHRALLFPRRLEERTPEGPAHWSPYDGRVHAGPGVTDNGFWDTFRTVYPLLALAYPEELGGLLEGWLNAFRAGGWLPKWASPGYRDSMVGTFADVVLADAVLKNISGFDAGAAWQAMRKDAFEASGPKDTSRGKFGLQHYASKGYVPVDVGVSEACSRTLDFAFADAAAAAAAARLGHGGDAAALRARSRRALAALFEEATGLMGHRTAAGAFRQEAPETWGDGFTEGSSWQHSFPPFDLAALAGLHGGRERLLARLWELLSTPSSYAVGSYRAEIHEMREMRMLGLGQYAHNNQPAHHLPYLFALLGDHNATAWLVRRVLAAAYSPEGFVGDEDNGEMGAWFVLSALGLYAAAPGVTEDYVLGAVPLFPRILLRALDVTVEAPAAPEEAPAITGVFWRAKAWTGPALPYSQLRAGGVLRFEAAGDARLGRVLSSLRGAWQSALRRARLRTPVTAGTGTPPVAAGVSGGAPGEGGGVAPAFALLTGIWLALALVRRACRWRLGEVEKAQ